MTSNCVVPRGDVLELLDDVREALPGELDDAQDVLDRRDELVDDADAGGRADPLGARRPTPRQRSRRPTPRPTGWSPTPAREAEQTLAQARHEAERAVADGAQAVHRAHRPGPQRGRAARWRRAGPPTSASSRDGPRRAGPAGVADRGRAGRQRRGRPHRRRGRGRDRPAAPRVRRLRRRQAAPRSRTCLGKALRRSTRSRSQLWRGAGRPATARRCRTGHRAWTSSTEPPTIPSSGTVPRGLPCGDGARRVEPDPETWWDHYGHRLEARRRRPAGRSAIGASRRPVGPRASLR